MKVTWSITEDDFGGMALLHIVFEDGFTENVALHLPPVGAGREVYVRQAVEAFVNTRAKSMALDSIRADLEHTIATMEEMHKQQTISPPRLAEYCISLLAPENTAQAQLGDLQEMFQANVRRFGDQEARRKYWMQVAASAWPLLWTWIKRFGLFTALIDYVRAKSGL